jgi:hypothetical protein
MLHAHNQVPAAGTVPQKVESLVIIIFICRRGFLRQQALLPANIKAFIQL